MSKNPRLIVTVKPHVKRTIERLAVVQDRSMSAIVGELLEELEPSLLRLVMLGEAFREMSESRKESLRQGIDAAEEQVHAAMMQAMEAAGLIESVLEDAVEAANGDENDGQPPISNTGVR